MPSKVLIIGAGVSGLSTAALLANENVSCKVFEKFSEVGGRTATSTYNGHIPVSYTHLTLPTICSV